MVEANLEIIPYGILLPLQAVALGVVAPKVLMLEVLEVGPVQLHIQAVVIPACQVKVVLAGVEGAIKAEAGAEKAVAVRMDLERMEGRGAVRAEQVMMELQLLRLHGEIQDGLPVVVEVVTILMVVLETQVDRHRLEVVGLVVQLLEQPSLGITILAEVAGLAPLVEHRVPHMEKVA